MNNDLHPVDDPELPDYGTFKPIWQILAREVIPQLVQQYESRTVEDEIDSDEISDTVEDDSEVD